MPFGSNFINGQAISEFINRYLLEIVLLFIVITVIGIVFKEKKNIDLWFSKHG